jgi:UDP-3-O-[3-hydroxymyristoyl] N-acetylglucosamine deacetylase
MKNRHTIKKEVRFEGVGVHSGDHVTVCLKPSEGGEILFRRSDLNNLALHVDPWKITAKNSSILTEGGHKIQTIEHLLAVLFMFGIESLVVEMNREEIPIMDGSAAPFVDAVNRTGIKSLPGQIKSIKILKDFVIKEGDALVSVKPDSGFKVSYGIEYDHPAIQSQELSLYVDKENFAREIAPARTFGFLKDFHR